MDQVCDSFEDAIRQEHDPAIEEFLTGFSNAERAEALRELLKVEVGALG